MMDLFYQLTAQLPSAPTSTSLALTTTSATTAALLPSGPSGRLMLVIYSTVDCFIRRGSTVLTDGTDMMLPAGTLMRVSINAGNTISAAAVTGTGTLYITPSA